MKKLPVIAVVGPTASGKTSLAVELCRRLGGEVVSADSMQIYRGMDIATAKPTAKEMCGVTHHIIDFLDMGSEFSVADYVGMAHRVIADISERGRIPVICGGTGLYVDSLINNIRFEKSVSSTPLREKLKKLAEEKGGAYLLEKLRDIDPETASHLHQNNLNRIIRALEVYETTGQTMSEHIRNSRSEESPYDSCVLGLDYKDRQVLYGRIEKRIDMMLEAGLLEEAEHILREPGLRTAAQAIGYKELAPYFDGAEPLEDCVLRLKQATRRYAKRQLTWFRKNRNIIWLYPDEIGSAEALYDIAEKIARDFLKGRTQ